MTNPFYTKTGAPAPNTQGRSGPIRDEFALVEAGFDAVDVEVDLKAPIASPAFTGTPTAPTPASVSDDTTKIATTAFVQDVLGASGALLPPQATHSGKYLGTDGSVAAWTAFPVAWSERVIFQDNTGFTPLPQQNAVANYDSTIGTSHRIYFCNSNFIAIPITSSSVAYTSPDGLTWTARTISSAGAWSDAAIVGNTIIIGDNSTTGSRSTDGGLTWSAVTFPASFTTLIGGAFFCGVSSTTAFYTSATGATGSWTLRTLGNPTNFTPTNGHYASFATGDYLFFGQGSGGTGAARSSDVGATWVTDTAAGAYRRAATDGTNVRLIEGNATVNGAYSTNFGDTWTGANFAANNTMHALCYGSKFVAVGYNSSTSYLTINYATGTGAWTSVAMGTTLGTFFAVAYNGTKYMAVGGTGSAKQCYTATGGAEGTWAATGAVPAGSASCSHITYDTTNSKWVVSDGTNTYWSADDGTSWTTGGALASPVWLGYLNGNLLAVTGTSLYRSTDSGANWSLVTTTPSTPGGTVYSIVWSANASAYFVKGGSTQIFKSTNLTDWSLAPSSTANFVGGGTALMALNSAYPAGWRTTDGVTWTSITLPAAYSATSDREDRSALTYSFLVSGTFYTTSNGGTSWSSASAVTGPAGNYAISFAGGYLSTGYVVSGLPSSIQFSTNGTDWFDYAATGNSVGDYFADAGTYAKSGNTIVSQGVTLNTTTTAIYYS